MPALGKTFTEGVVGQPRFINPIYGETNDIDRTLIELVFSGLMTYDNQGNIVNDLTDQYTVSKDGKTYNFTLKNNIFWHDSKPLTSDDVIFTIKTIQNSDYKSPLRANWIDVSAEKLSDKSFSLTLKQPYNSFLENCTLKIIPKHIWENISPENFILSLYNLQPIGSGPFAFDGLTQTKTGHIENLQLKSNRRYYNLTSFIANFNFKFSENTDDLLNLAKSRQINGFSVANSDKNVNDLEAQLGRGWVSSQKFNRYSFLLPRYFAVFLNNQKSSIFSDSNIRKALLYSVNKEELNQNITLKTGIKVSMVDSPILPDFYGYQAPQNIYSFDKDKANALLDKTGFKLNESGQREKTTTKNPAFQFKGYLKVGSKGSEVTQLQNCLLSLPKTTADYASLMQGYVSGTYALSTENAVTEFQKEYLPTLKPTGETGDSTRKKFNELCATPIKNTQNLTFTLATINQPQLLEVANALKIYWQAVGIQVNINAVSITDLKPIIKNRSYDALLYGETLGMEPDLYPFWYSSQKQDPGLNLSAYENKEVDKLLKNARQSISQKQVDLEKLQNLIIADAPALFLYNPNFTYFASQNVQGINAGKIADPAKRFININNWYISTKRIWK